MISKTLSAARLETILTALKGPNGNDGLAFRPLPVRKVLFPLLRFVEDAGRILEPVLKARAELYRRGQEAQEADATDEELWAIQEEINDLMDQEFDIRVLPICGSCLDDREDITLADLQLLSTFFPGDREEDDGGASVEIVE